MNMPPSSQEAEDAILGAIIDSPSLLDEVTAYLSEEIFYYNRSRRLYSIILNMHKDGELIEIRQGSPEKNSYHKHNPDAKGEPC